MCYFCGMDGRLRSRLPVLNSLLPGPRLRPVRPGSDLLNADAPEPPIDRGGLPRVRPNEIALMFSGGVDSTASAVMLAEHYDKVHLVTYRNGYGHWYHHRSQMRVDKLNRRLGERFTHSLITTKGYFDDVVVDSVLADYKRYRSGFIWFMGCKMAMHMRTILFCLEHGLLRATDGSNSDTAEMVEQSLLSLSLIRFFYEDHTVDFGTPVYEVRRAESRELIRELDIRMGVQVMDRHLCIQPTCVAGELYYLPYLLMNKPVNHDERQVSRFIEEKEAICRRIMSAYFEGRGIDLDALLADRKRQIEQLGASEGEG
jgi:hypothetical protein